jgi:transposase
MTRKPVGLSLTRNERRSLKMLFHSGQDQNRVQTRARILDLLDRQMAPAEIATFLSCAVGTVYNVRRRYEQEGLEAALREKPRSGRPVEIHGTQRAKLTALACSTAPAGHARWTLRLLVDKAVELGFVEHLSHNAVKEILKKQPPSALEKAMVYRGPYGRVSGPYGRHPASLQLAVQQTAPSSLL